MQTSTSTALPGLLSRSSSFARGPSLFRLPADLPVSLQGSTVDTNSQKTLSMIKTGPGSPLRELRLDGSSACLGSFGGADGSESLLLRSAPLLSSEPSLPSSLSDTLSATDGGSAQEAC